MKYPRTPHLPWSPGATEDDLHTDATHFEGRQVVVTEKLDGENTTMTRERVHARSLDSGYHPSRTRVKTVHGRVGYLLDEGMRICGENLQAVHSIEYTHLPGPFIVFSIWDHDLCLGWDRTEKLCEQLGLPTAPVLYRGIYDPEKIQSCQPTNSAYGPTAEGYVVRSAESFLYGEFTTHVAKWVRPNHVQTDQHWSHGQMRENGGL